jgi:acetoacetate decarboxylase
MKKQKTSSIFSVFAVFAIFACVVSAAEDSFQPHADVIGPKRLQMEKADNSGVVNTDPQFIADRQAILNHVTAYSFLIDEARWEDWFDLFSDDVVFETTVPGMIGTVIAHGKEAFREIVKYRYIIPNEEASKGVVRRHTMGNMHVVEQTPTTAKVRTYMLISKVPHADKLLTLTTGTYNVELEKRNGKWTITRWYIECDAPLAPSEFPSSNPNVEHLPDPSFVIPDATTKPIEGKIALKGLPYSMPAVGPLYKLSKEPMYWKDCDFIIVDYLTTAEAAAAFLPEGVTTFPIKDAPGYSAVKIIWAKYRESSVGAYNELIVAIPCLYGKQMWLYVPLIYVTTDQAMASGREIGGWPKKLANIDIQRVGNNYQLVFERHGMELSCTATVGKKMFSTPIAANDTIEMSFPYNVTLPLPPASDKPQPAVPLPTLTFKYIPGIGSANPKPVVAQLIGAPWMLSGDFHATANVAMNVHSTEEDPLGKLPVLNLLGATFISGDMTLDIKEMQVLKDMLK